MGIIRRQALSGTIFSYLGVGIGFITTALIFPEVLTTSEIGLISIFLSYAYLFSQFATLGTGRISIVFFPFFNNRKISHHGFFALLTLISIIGLFAVLAVFYLIQGWLINNANDTSDLFGEYIDYLYPMIIFTTLFMMADSFNTTLYNAIRGIFLKEFLQRVLILVAITVFALSWIDFSQFVLFFVMAIGIPAFILIYYLVRNREFSLKPAFSPLLMEKRRPMASIGAYGIIIGFSGMVILNIDRIMVERMLGLGLTGIYSTMAYFATLVAIPSRALLKISDPVIAQSWKDNNIKSLQDNYYRSSLNQFLIGSLLLVGIWGNIENILRILPPEFTEGKLVILFIGLAFLADMATGTATYILANSKYFRFQTLYILILVIFIIISNFLLIPVWGLAGAAIATLISKILSNLIRHLILYRKFGLQPYNYKFLIIVGISATAYLVQFFTPLLNNLYLDLIIRSAIISTIFIFLTISLKVSPEVNERYKWIIAMLLHRK